MVQDSRRRVQNSTFKTLPTSHDTLYKVLSLYMNSSIKNIIGAHRLHQTMQSPWNGGSWDRCMLNHIYTNVSSYKDLWMNYNLYKCIYNALLGLQKVLPLWLDYYLINTLTNTLWFWRPWAFNTAAFFKPSSSIYFETTVTCKHHLVLFRLHYVTIFNGGWETYITMNWKKKHLCYVTYYYFWIGHPDIQHIQRVQFLHTD